MMGLDNRTSRSYRLRLSIWVLLAVVVAGRSEEHTSELQSQSNLVCRLLLEKKNPDQNATTPQAKGSARFGGNQNATSANLRRFEESKHPSNSAGCGGVAFQDSPADEEDAGCTA